MRVMAALFAKAPGAGRSKTRLVPLVGEEQATALARCFLADTWSRLQAIEGLDTIISCPDGDAGGFDLAPAPRCWAQGEGDLGAKIQRTAGRCLEQADAVLAIGADSPDLPTQRVHEAIEALRTADAAIIPAEDGGFVLLGLKSCPDGLLDALPWSHPSTCTSTIDRLRSRGLSVARLEPWPDVDHPADLRALHTRLEVAPQSAPRTAGWLAKHPLPPTLGVVVPTLQEASRIESQLDLLQSLPTVDSIVVSDGESTDGTADLARARGVTVVQGPAGRARQLNRGAAAIDTQLLWFVHADVRPPREAPRLIRNVLGDKHVAAGTFRIRTVAEQQDIPWSSLLRVADLRSRHTRLPYGDQTLFLRRELFDQLGGFPEIDVFEDVAMARLLRRQGKLVTLDTCVEVSGRRFLNRPVQTALAWTLLPLLFRCGVSPETLAPFYKPVR